MNKEKIEKITRELKRACGMELVSVTSRNTGTAFVGHLTEFERKSSKH